MCIFILNTSKWPIEHNEAFFETGLEHDTGVVNMITCTGKTSHQRLVRYRSSEHDYLYWEDITSKVGNYRLYT